VVQGTVGVDDREFEQTVWVGLGQQSGHVCLLSGFTPRAGARRRQGKQISTAVAICTATHSGRCGKARASDASASSNRHRLGMPPPFNCEHSALGTVFGSCRSSRASCSELN
jgi:hypothetical protein